MFSKNPFMMPLIGVAVLIGLFMFQRQQQRTAEQLKAEAPAAIRAADSLGLTLLLNDPVYGSSKGDTVRCGKNMIGLVYTLRGDLARGLLEFDILSAKSAANGAVPLCALLAPSAEPCAADLPSASLMVLAFQSGPDTLLISTNLGKASARIGLPVDGIFPYRVRLEWEAGTLLLFLNGRETGRLALQGAAAKELKLLLGQNSAKSAESGAELRSLKVHVAAPAAVYKAR